MALPDSTLLTLTGSSSGATYDADRLQRLDGDDRPLLATYDLEAAARTLTPQSLRERPRGLWRWRELLPVRDPAAIVDLGEGDTPLVAARRLGERLDLTDLRIKAEGGNPTGSFKARGMTAAVSRNAELGATSFIAPSAGNAAGALAAYAAAAGVPATVLMPVDAPLVNQIEVQVCGARLVLVEGLISDCGKVGAQIAARTGAFDVSTLKEPYRVEGKKTMGLELAEQYGWRLPDVILYPTGGGTGLVGMWKAFDELEQIGLIGAERPRMVAVQASGCAPIVRAFETGATEAEPWQGAKTRAGGIRVPGAVGDRLILQAVRDSQGTAVAVDEDDIDRAQLLAGSHGAGYVSPETGAVFAAVGELRASGWIGRDERVVAFDTGIGAKYPPPPLPGRTPTVDPGDYDLDELLAVLATDAR
ncbi:MAG TPA: threonine synthase [Egicoccus sp.]|nr:threonine synthase [Egicoccus sp.]HSK23353.1 threonine synthase [Egicoccus sp.]